MAKRDRLDKVLVERGLVRSREYAQQIIKEGKLIVRGLIDLKPSSLIDINSEITIMDEPKYVSRGGIKLEAALEHFNIPVHSKTAIDVGASTGGFTDCLLQRGAKRVYCVDVGYGQLAWKLRQDERVVVLDRINARYLNETSIPEPLDMAVIDVSFISLRLIIPPVVGVLKQTAEVIALIKPQFEVGKGEVGKGGIVKEKDKRLRAVKGVCEFIRDYGLTVIGTMESPIKGQQGNVEYFVYALKHVD